VLTGKSSGDEAVIAPKQIGLNFDRVFTTPDVHPYDAVEWELRDARISNEKGDVIFEQNDVEVPKAWSQTATNVVVSKYFRGQLGTEGRETSVRQLIGRVADTMTEWGRKDGYFATDDDVATFHAELTHILLHQVACFNSPVWFNVGIEERPQCSACFINSVQDTMPSILGLAKTEGMLFKFGSGTGSVPHSFAAVPPNTALLTRGESNLQGYGDLLLTRFDRRIEPRRFRDCEVAVDRGWRHVRERLADHHRFPECDPRKSRELFGLGHSIVPRRGPSGRDEFRVVLD